MLRADRRGSAFPRRRPVLARRLQEPARAGGRPRADVRGEHPPAAARRKARRSDLARRHRSGRRRAVAFVNLVEQQREVEVATIDADAFVKDVKVDDAQVKAFYDANAGAFKTPEEAKFEYVVLTQDALLAQIAVTPEEVKAQYDSAAKTYTQDEQRQAAHILIAVKPDATDAEKAAAKKTADDIAAQAKANPAKFGELAKQYSQDPGSAPQGGDLGSNPRGTMVKAFDDAVFAMKPGEIVGPVQSEFGWHVIRLERRHACEDATVRRGEGADRDGPEAAEGPGRSSPRRRTSSRIWSTSRPIRSRRSRRRWGSPCRRRRFVTRAQAQQVAMGNAKLVQALFSPESIAAQAQHGGDRSRPEYADGGAHRRVQAGGGASVRRREGRDPPAAHAPRQPSSWRRRPGARSSRCSSRARATRKPASFCEAGDARCATGCSRDSRPRRSTRIFQADPTKLPHYIGRDERPRRILDLQARQGDDAAAGRAGQADGGREIAGSARCRTARSSTPTSTR